MFNTKKFDDLLEEVKKEFSLTLDTKTSSERYGKSDNATKELLEELKKIGRGGTEEEKAAWVAKKRALGRVDFTGANLSNLDLSHINFEGVSLGGANLSHSNLQWSNFSGVKCMLANFEGANLHLSDFTGALAINANFKGAKVTGAGFRSALLPFASFEDAYLNFSDFNKSVFYGVNLKNAEVDGTRFDNTYYIEDVLPQAKIKSAILLLDQKQIKKALDL
jgi:uncharacterized protein YjbI with pentapeptide repeats